MAENSSKKVTCEENVCSGSGVCVLLEAGTALQSVECVCDLLHTGQRCQHSVPVPVFGSSLTTAMILCFFLFCWYSSRRFRTKKTYITKDSYRFVDYLQQSQQDEINYLKKLHAEEDKENALNSKTRLHLAFNPNVVLHVPLPVIVPSQPVEKPYSLIPANKRDSERTLKRKLKVSQKNHEATGTNADDGTTGGGTTAGGTTAGGTTAGGTTAGGTTAGGTTAGGTTVDGTTVGDTVNSTVGNDTVTGAGPTVVEEKPKRKKKIVTVTDSDTTYTGRGLVKCPSDRLVPEDCASDVRRHKKKERDVARKFEKAQWNQEQMSREARKRQMKKK